MKTSEYIALTGQEYHLEVLKVLQKEHTSVHHVEQTLVDELVLVVDNLHDALLYRERHRYVKDVGVLALIFLFCFWTIFYIHINAFVYKVFAKYGIHTLF